MTVSQRSRIMGSALLLVLASAPAWALYKVVGPNGEITYTDRPPADAKKAAPLKTTANATAATDGLPYALQQVVVRYPVTFYTADKCAPCDQGRQYLNRRGIPFVEKTIKTDADAKAYKGLTGTEQLPTLKVGSQQITGFGEGEWNAYLSAAGYPEQSQLPASYKQLPPSPMVSTSSVAPPKPAVEPQPTAPTPTSPAPTGSAPPGFRF